jgi:hypothetical protein
MLALLGKSIDIVEPPPSDEDWHANVLWLERRKCLLLAAAPARAVRSSFAHSQRKRRAK